MNGASITGSVYIWNNAGCGLVIFLIYKRPKKENAKFHFIEYWTISRCKKQKCLLPKPFRAMKNSL